MSIRDFLTKHFQAAPSAPFLFVGSGFSRRYLGLEDWAGLLKRFCEHLPNPFEYYLATADGNMPKVARLMAEDFHNVWWKTEVFAESRGKYASGAKDTTSALRIEICNYLNGISNAAIDNSYTAEIEILSRLNVDGILTTNWDLLLESLFPDFKVFVGQGELLFSNPQSIGEIYKIHGSASKPSSLVLTSDDYANFDRLNPYLAAKIITLFVEHPIVFLGYSLSDVNIASMLKAIVNVLGQDNLFKLQNNLIFIRRANGGEPSYAKTILTIEQSQLPITVVTTDDYVPVYEALDSVKRKIPARVLRHCKEQLYELVRMTEPGEKLLVLDVDDIDNKDDVEFVIGVGVAAAERAGRIGYKGVGFNELFHDLLFHGANFDPELILKETIPNLGKQSKYIPIFRYMKAMGIDSDEKLAASGLDVAKHVPGGVDFYRGGAQYNKSFMRTAQGMSAADIIKTFPPEKAATYLPFLPRENFDAVSIGEFLQKHSERLQGGSPYSTFYRKLACMYDWVSNGWSRSAASSKT